MRAILKVIWFYVIVFTRQYIYDYILQLKESSYIYKIQELPIVGKYLTGNVDDLLIGLNNTVLMTLLFLGLDLINGQFSGVLKGPIKIILNTIIYLLGFGVLFFVIQQFKDFQFLNL